MVLLDEPDEGRLWLVIAILLGASLALMFASFQVPWYTATLFVGEADAHSEFDFKEASFELSANGQVQNTHDQAYTDDSVFGKLMGRVEVFVGFGTFAAVGLAGLLFSHHRGWWSNGKLIVLSWLLGVGGILTGLVYFMLNAGRAGSEEVQRLLSMYGAGGPTFGPPQPKFWGTQDYAGGELVSAPGVGWLLAILALLNLGAAVLLLYQFPSTSQTEEDEGDLASFETPGPEGPGGTRAGATTGGHRGWLIGPVRPASVRRRLLANGISPGALEATGWRPHAAA